jgi:ATP-dependent Clp protease protease subunit
MQYCIDPLAEEPIMLINKHIGFDPEEGQGIDGSLFQEELLALDAMGKSRIQIWINSGGGVVMDGYNIYSAILNTKTKVDTYCTGIAASIAAVIFQAGRKRIMMDYGVLMYHNPYGGDDKKQLEVMTQSIAKMIAERSGKTIEQVLEIMKKTSWIPASEALIDGLCDEMQVSSEKNKKRVAQAADKWKESNKILNSILKPKNMNKITNKLGLVEDANENSIVTAIEKLQATVNKAEDDKSKLEELVKKLKEKHDAEMDELKSKYAEMEDKAKKAEDEKAKAEAEAEDAKCSTVLNKYVAQGRIKADSLDKWKNLSKNIGIDEVTTLIESSPLNKTAHKIEVGKVANEQELTNVAASTMVALRNKFNI